MANPFGDSSPKWIISLLQGFIGSVISDFHQNFSAPLQMVGQLAVFMISLFALIISWEINSSVCLKLTWTKNAWRSATMRAVYAKISVELKTTVARKARLKTVAMATLVE